MTCSQRDRSPSTEHTSHADGSISRSSQDDWSEESSRQAAALAANPPEPQRLFSEFRRKLASGETLSRALARLAEALRFSGRITVTLHQGKVTKTVLEESYFGGGGHM